MAGNLKGLTLMILGLACCAAALADSKPMPDPMRPSGTAGQAFAQGQTDPISAVPQLQALRLRAQQPTALITGQWLGLGETLGTARIVAIDERGVVLRRDGAVELLKLVPSFQSVPGTPTANKP